MNVNYNLEDCRQFQVTKIAYLLMTSCLGDVLAEDDVIEGVLCSSLQSLLPRPLSVRDAPPGEYLMSPSVISWSRTNTTTGFFTSPASCSSAIFYSTDTPTSSHRQSLLAESMWKDVVPTVWLETQRFGSYL